MHLPISSDDTLYICRYLCTHVLVAEEQFLLIIDVPMQDHMQQFEIYQVFKLLIPEGNLSAWYNIDTKYFGISQDEMKAVGILEQQFATCQWANGQFCNLDAPLQLLANPPTCITAVYAKNEVGSEQQCSLQVRNTHSSTIPTAITRNLWLLTSTTESVLQELSSSAFIKHHCSSKYRNLFTFSFYHQAVVPCPDISIYHLAMKIIRWGSTYYSIQPTLTGWMFHHWSSEYGNIWRTIGTRPNCTNLLTYLQFLLLTCINTRSTITDLLFHLL